MGTPAPSSLADLTARVDELEHAVSDHAQRFDTAQTWWWKRILFWLDGWPLHDWNGTQRRRPWHRRR